MAEMQIDMGFRAATPTEARAWVRGSVIELWDARDATRLSAIVGSWNESGMRVTAIDAARVPQLVAIDLQVWDGDMEPPPSYAPRSADGRYVALSAAHKLHNEVAHDAAADAERETIHMESDE